MSRSAIVFVLLMQVFVLSWLYVLCWIYIFYSQTANKHENAWVRLHIVDLRLKGVGSHFFLLLFSTCKKKIIYKSQNLSTKKNEILLRQRIKKEGTKKKIKKFHHSSNIWQAVMNSSLHKYICTVFFFIIFNFNF